MSILIYIALNGLGLAVILLLTARSLTRYGTAALVVQPFVIFGLCFGLIHFFMPLYKLALGRWRYPAEYSATTLLITVLLSLLALALSGLFLRDPGRRFRRTKDPGPLLGVRPAWSAGLILCTVAGFGMFMSARQISVIGVETFQSDRILHSTDIGLYSRISTIILPGIVLLIAGKLAAPPRSRIRALSGWALILGLILYTLQYYAVTQSRNPILLLIMTAAVTCLYYRPRPLTMSGRGILSWALMLLAPAALIAGALSLTFRRFDGRSGAYARTALDNLLYTFLDGAFGNDENILWLIETEAGFYYGETYLSGFLNVIPRAVWADKPVGAGPELRNLIYPGSYIRGAEGNTSFTTGFLTEAWMNFGPAGSLIVGFLWALWQRKMVKTLLRSRRVPVQALAIFTICFFSSAFLYSEFLGLMGRYLICLAAAGGVLALIRLASACLPGLRR